MPTVKGTFHNGSAQPLEPVAGRDGQSVLIVFVEEAPPSDAAIDAGWDALMQLIADTAVETGIGDLAHHAAWIALLDTQPDAPRPGTAAHS